MTLNCVTTVTALSLRWQNFLLESDYRTVGDRASPWLQLDEILRCSDIISNHTYSRLREINQKTMMCSRHDIVVRFLASSLYVIARPSVCLSSVKFEILFYTATAFTVSRGKDVFLFL